MTVNKKIAKITMIILVSAGIGFGLYYYFNMIKKGENESNLVEMNLPLETQNIKFAIEEVKMQKLKWNKVLSIKGWVFKENVKSGKRDVYFVFKSEKDTLIFKIEKNIINRPDVTEYFKMDGTVNNHGFELSVPLDLLTENIYQVGFILQDETGKYCTMSSEALRISEDDVKLSDEVDPDLKAGSSLVTIKLESSTRNVKSNFENINNFGNDLIISGWGFLEELNSDSLKSYILLKKNGIVTVFNVDIQIRKDVTAYYEKSGINLDSSGFLAHIRKENLTQGRYQVGLYIVRGKQKGTLYTDKYIDFGH